MSELIYIMAIIHIKGVFLRYRNIDICLFGIWHSCSSPCHQWCTTRLSFGAHSILTVLYMVDISKLIRPSTGSITAIQMILSYMDLVNRMTEQSWRPKYCTVQMQLQDRCPHTTWNKKQNSYGVVPRDDFTFVMTCFQLAWRSSFYM